MRKLALIQLVVFLLASQIVWAQEAEKDSVQLSKYRELDFIVYLQ